MEKIIYSVWKKSEHSVDDFRADLLGSMSRQLLDAGVLKLKVCIVDKDVEEAAQYRMEASKPAIDGLVSLWVNSAICHQVLEQIITGFTSRLDGYLVSESEPLVNTEQRVPQGQRTPGMNQVVFLKKPKRLSYEQWLEIWLQSHTQIAIDTQSTFSYRQNLIVRPLTASAPAFDAIVEENFPVAAMSDRAAFYNAVGDQALYKKREQQMIDSCIRFIDFDQLDCIPSSEYVVKE